MSITFVLPSCRRGDQTGCACRKPHPGMGPFKAPWIAAGFALSVAVASGWGGAEAGLPDALDNPSRSAFRHHRLEVTLDPATAGLAAIDRITLVHAPDHDAHAKTPFLLNRNLTIGAIEAWEDGHAVPLRWEERDRWEPRDFWARPQYADLADLGHARQVDLYLRDPGPGAVWPESLQITIRYEGAVYDSLKPPPESYQRGFETTTGLIDPRGAYLTVGTLWYPERFDEPYTFELTARTPEDWLTVSQGRRLDGHGWDCPQPMDGIYLIAGPYRLHEEMHQGVAVQTFTYGNDDEELCRRYLDATRRYLDLYSDRIGPYPFAKFALVENFWQTGYGMPSFTLLGDRVIRLPWIIDTSYGHEILHNWWGNGVFVDWESGNWCEGLTVYGADYLYKELESEDAARAYRRTTLQGYLDYTRAGRDFPLTEFRERHDASSAAIGYGKSMMLYHMLRRASGDAAFWRALQTFYDDYLFERADWHDLLGAFERVLDDDLRGDFYDQWIARPGAPRLALAATDLVRTEGGGYTLRYVIEQDEPCYALDVPVQLTYPDGKVEAWDVHLEGPSFEITRDLPRKPRSLAVDPAFDVFRRLHRAEIPAALSQIHGADSLTLVIAAGEDDSLVAAFEEIAADAGRAQPVASVSDADLVLPDLRAGSVWVLGAARWMDRLAELLPGSTAIGDRQFRIAGESFDRATHTLVLVVPHPHARDEAVGLLLASDPESAAGVWRKLPHYGKYSYLVFEGTSNVAKGTWEVERSPMVMVWDEEN